MSESIQSPAVTLAKQWVNAISHNNSLRSWLNDGEVRFLAECNEFIANGYECKDYAGKDYAAIHLCANPWRPDRKELTAELMRSYVRAGTIKLDAKAFIGPRDDPSSSFIHLNGCMPLVMSMVSCNADATCVLLEAGAAEVTDFSPVLTDFGEGEPDPLGAFDAFARSQFASDPVAMSRFTKILMERRLEALSVAPTTLAASQPEAIPTRRRRVL